MIHLLAFSTLILLGSSPADAHDPSSWGGLFRSRDDGARWLPVNEGRFIGGALALAVSPVDHHHLLLGTDSGLLRSSNAGRDWSIEAPAVLVGAVFAMAFDADGVRALASTARGLFRTDGGPWRTVSITGEALPARAIVTSAPGRAYLAGASGVWRTDDWGATWSGRSDGLPDAPVSALLVRSGPPEIVWVVAGGRLWSRADADREWQPRDSGLPEGRVETAAFDTANDARLWAAAADHVFRSDDGGRAWVPIGKRLPENNTSVRGIAVARDGASIVLTTHRGLYRSADAGESWALMEGMLPVHLEAGPLARDPAEPATLYAGFAITPYNEMWRMAARGESMLSRLDLLSWAGGAAFLVVIGVAAFAAIRRLGHYYGRSEPAPAERAR